MFIFFYQVLVVRNEDESLIIIKRSIHICQSGGDTQRYGRVNTKHGFFLDTSHLPNCGTTQFNRCAESIGQRYILTKKCIFSNLHGVETFVMVLGGRMVALKEFDWM